jgi:acetyl esterase/lipase
MGGRVALRVADYRSLPSGGGGGSGGGSGSDKARAGGGGERDPGREGRDANEANSRRGVSSVAALAPWLPDGEPPPVLGDRSLLLAHGSADRTTDPVKTARLAEKLRAAGADVEHVEFPGGRHSMLFPARPWHDLVAGFMVRRLLAPARQV